MTTTTNDAAPLPQLLTLAQAAEILGVSLKTLQRRIDGGALPVIRDGRVIRVHPVDLARYIAVRRSL
jgi:excisionase family DNA binding protein